MRKILTILLLCGSAFAGTCGNGYSNGPITITVDHTKVPNTDQTDFVSTICFNGACRTSWPLAALKTAANGGSIQNTAANAASITGPADFILCDASSAGNAVPFVIPYYNAVTGATEVKYKKTLSHTVDTSVYLFFNNSSVSTSQQDITNTFSNNFLHYYTFGDGTSVAVYDLLGTNNLTAPSDSYQTVGTSGGGFHAHGGASSSSTAYTTATTNVTFSLNMQWGGFSQLVAVWENGSAGNRYGLEIGSAGCGTSNTLGLLFGGITCNALSGSYTLTAGKWIHVTIKRDATTWRLLVDGSQISTTTSNPNSVSAFSSIGNSVLDVKMDDFSVASVMRSDDWNATETNNEDQFSFYSSVTGIDSSSTPHIVQYNACSFNLQSVSTTASCAFPHAVTSGNLLVIAENPTLPVSGDTACSSLSESDTLSSSYTLRQSALAPSGSNTVGTCIWSAAAASSGTNASTTTYSTSHSTDKFIVEVAGVGTTLTASSTDSATAVNPFVMSSVSVPSNSSFMLCRAAISPTGATNAFGSLSSPSSLVFGKTSPGSAYPGDAVAWGFIDSGSKNCTIAGGASFNVSGATVVFGSSASVSGSRRSAQVY